MKRLFVWIVIGVLCLATFSMLGPRTEADESDALLSIDPSEVEFWTPAHGKTFDVNVTLLNVTSLYGYEFKVNWNTTLLDVIAVNVTPPTSWGNNTFVAANETNEALGAYWLGVTLLPPASTFSGNVTLATLTFKITHDPIHPTNATSSLDLTDTYLSDENAASISHNVAGGQYSLYSTKPEVKVQTSPLSGHTANRTEIFSINVTVSDVVNLYGYEFGLAYNASLLDVVNVQVGNFLKEPYYVYKFNVNHTSGNVTLGVASQSALPVAPPANGSGLLATISFTTISVVWPDPAQNTSLHLYDTVLKTNLDVLIPHDSVDGFYEYVPAPGDANSDGQVNVLDLRIVARAYGTRPGDLYWDPRADLNRDGLINVFDLVLVSKNYGI